MGNQQVSKIGLTKPPRQQLKLRNVGTALIDVPAAKVLPAPKATQQYIEPVVDRKWLSWISDGPIAVAGMIPGLLTMLEIVIGLPVAIFAPHPIHEILLGSMLASQASWIGLGLVGSKVHRAKARNFEAFLRWLHDRYGIRLSAKQGLHKIISAQSPFSHRGTIFVDDTGRKFVLNVSTADTFSISKLDNSRSEPARLVDATKLLSTPDVYGELSRPLCALYGQLQQSLTLLSERKLSPESDHVVNRAKRDATQVVKLYSDLVHMNALDRAQEEAVQATFKSLVEEVKEIARKETAFALAELTVETTYVAARQPRKGIELKKEAKR